MLNILQFDKEYATPTGYVFKVVYDVEHKEAVLQVKNIDVFQVVCTFNAEGEQDIVEYLLSQDCQIKQ